MSAGRGFQFRFFGFVRYTLVLLQMPVQAQKLHQSSRVMRRQHLQIIIKKNEYVPAAFPRFGQASNTLSLMGFSSGRPACNVVAPEAQGFFIVSAGV